VNAGRVQSVDPDAGRQSMPSVAARHAATATRTLAPREFLPVLRSGNHPAKVESGSARHPRRHE
jgi:hypothetical protein